LRLGHGCPAGETQKYENAHVRATEAITARSASGDASMRVLWTVYGQTSAIHGLFVSVLVHLIGISVFAQRRIAGRMVTEA
jgi:hypothetical protein